jgi:sterol desaturase/sphingolipid hydroxylase (fatty acid hydroxylase superfamily)
MDNYKIATAAIFTLIILYETLLPFKAYIGRLKHYTKNIAFSLINSFITGLTSAALSVYAFNLIEENNLGLLRQFQLTPMASAILALLLLDLWIYSWHRMNHTLPLLWRFHQVHHNDTQMDSSTALRFHPGEILISSVLEILFFIIAGLQIEHVILYKTVLRINIFIHHSNIKIPASLDRSLRLINGTYALLHRLRVGCG